MNPASDNPVSPVSPVSANPVRRLGLVAHPDRDQARSLVEYTSAWCAARGIAVEVAEAQPLSVDPAPGPSGFGRGCDAVLAFGGS